MVILENVRIKLGGSIGNRLYLPANLYPLRARCIKLLFRAGTRSIQRTLRIFPSTKHSHPLLSLDQLTYHSLSIPFDITSNVRVTDDALTIGPILGVFISPTKVNRMLKGDIDSIYSQFHEWAQSVGGIVYFFSLNELDARNQSVLGCLPNRDQRWVQGKLPLPKVIYDRCFGAKGRKHSYRLREVINQQ